MPVLAALPAIAAVAGTAASVKSLASGSGGAPAYGGGPERAVDEAGAAKAYGNVEGSLQNQQAFINALNAANGIGNQSSVYNQLQGVTNGTGPNPAKAMLAQATGQNVANQGALMASQRGAGANAGLIARQAAQQGGNLQQQAAGQGATLQANQSLNALGQMGGIANNQVGNQAAATQGLSAAEIQNYGQLLNQITAQNNTAAGLQSNVNNNNTSAGINNANNLMNAGGSLLNASGGAAGLLGPQTPTSAGSGSGGNLAGGSGPASTMAMKAYGGEITEPAPSMAAPGPSSAFGRSLSSKPMPAMAKGGKVPAIVSPGERYIPPAQAKQVAKGEKKATEVGEVIKGKASTKGDSYSNDTVKKSLSPGGVVVPRTKNMGDAVTEKATAFVRAVLAKGGHR